jgi:hypothetical protein
MAHGSRTSVGGERVASAGLVSSCIAGAAVIPDR